jgi:hypothetical protein
MSGITRSGELPSGSEKGLYSVQLINKKIIVNGPKEINSEHGTIWLVGSFQLANIHKQMFKLKLNVCHSCNNLKISYVPSLRFASCKKTQEYLFLCYSLNFSWIFTSL